MHTIRLRATSAPRPRVPSVASGRPERNIPHQHRSVPPPWAVICLSRCAGPLHRSPAPSPPTRAVVVAPARPACCRRRRLRLARSLALLPERQVDRPDQTRPPPPTTTTSSAQFPPNPPPHSLNRTSILDGAQKAQGSSLASIAHPPPSLPRPRVLPPAPPSRCHPLLSLPRYFVSWGTWPCRRAASAGRPDPTPSSTRHHHHA